MGTRGYYAYRHKGRYFKKYNHNDSYPNHLGARLMSFIPEDPEKFKLWLENTRATMASFGKEGAKGLNREDFEVSEGPPMNDLMIEWTYVYDLDNLAFTIQGKVHYRLDNVPRGRDDDGMLWIEKYIYCDQTHRICRAPFTPTEYCARMVAIEPLLAREMADFHLFEAAQVQKIESSAWMNAPEDSALTLSHKLAAVAAEGLIAGFFSRFSEAYAHFDEPWYESFAKELLTTASPASAEFSAEEKVIKGWSKRLDGKRGHRARKMFWFRGHLVILAAGLDRPGRFKSSVGMVIRHVKKLGLGECTAILWSIEHVAVVLIGRDSVSCSEAIGVVAAFGRDEVELKQGLGLIAHYLPPPCVQGSPSFDNRLPLDIFLRVMAFSDVQSAVMLGRTSRALRLEWLKRPAIGPYTLLFPAQDEECFIARVLKNGDAASSVKLSIRFPRCMRYDEYRHHVQYAEVNLFGGKRNYEERDRVVYGPGSTPSAGETKRVTHDVHLRVRFIDFDYKKSPSWRLIEIGSDTEH